MISQTITRLQQDFGAHLLKVEKVLPLPHDIDLYASEVQQEKIVLFLKSQGFVCTEYPGACHARRFEGGHCYLLDVTFDPTHFADLFPGTRFTPLLREAMIADGELESFVKHTFSLNEDPKVLRLAPERLSKFQHILSDSEYVLKSPFRKKLKTQTFVLAMRKRPSALVCTFTCGGMIRLAFGNLRLRFKRLGKGSIIAVIGPDGSGKSMVVDALSAALFSPKLYMGDWGFAFQSLYNFLYAQHIVIARFVYPFQYVENWFRYMRALMLKMAGETVIVDRYPGLNRHLRSNTVWLRLIDVLYSFFPRADKYLFISAPPEVVFARRQELTIEEIAATQKNIRLRMHSLPHREIQNIEMDTCLNEALRYVLGESR